MVVGRLLSYWEGIFSVAMLNFGGYALFEKEPHHFTWNTWKKNNKKNKADPQSTADEVIPLACPSRLHRQLLLVGGFNDLRRIDTLNLFLKDNLRAAGAPHGEPVEIVLPIALT